MSFANLLGPGGYISSAYLPARALSDELVLENADTTEITLVAGGQSSAELNCAGGLLVNATGGTVAINSAAGQITMPKPGTTTEEGILFFPDTVNNDTTCVQVEAFYENFPSQGGVIPTARVQVPFGNITGCLFTNSQAITNGTLNVSGGGNDAQLDVSATGCITPVVYQGTGSGSIQVGNIPTIAGLTIDLVATGPISSTNNIVIRNGATGLFVITQTNSWTRLFFGSDSNWYAFTMPSATPFTP